MNIYKKCVLAIIVFLLTSISYQAIGYSSTYSFLKASQITTFRDEQIHSYILRHSRKPPNLLDYAVIRCIENKYSFENSLVTKDLEIRLRLPKEGFFSETGNNFVYDAGDKPYTFDAIYKFIATKSIYEDIDEEWDAAKEGNVKITKIKKYRGKLYKVYGEFNIRLDLIPLDSKLNFITKGNFTFIISSRKTLEDKKEKAIGIDTERITQELEHQIK